MGFVSIFIGYLFYALYMMKNMFRNGKNRNITIDFFDDHIEVLSDVNGKTEIPYSDISYYVAKKGFYILNKKDRNRLYVENQFSSEFNDFLTTNIEKRKKLYLFGKHRVRYPTISR